MAVKYFLSTDVGAPQITGNGVNDVVNLLDALLVSGYGAKPSLGWTTTFTASGKRVYRMSSVGTDLGYYLRVVDNVDTNRSATWQLYKSMTDIDNGVPSLGFNCYLQKSSTNDAFSRPWFAAGDETSFLFYLWGDGTVGTTTWSQHIYFGQAKSDQEGCNGYMLVNGRTNASLNITNQAYTGSAIVSENTWTGNPTNMWSDRNNFGQEVLTYYNRMPVGIASGGGSVLGTQTLGSIFDPVTGIIHIDPVYAVTGDRLFHLRLPLIFNHSGTYSANQSLNYFDIVAGSGDDAGKNFMLVPVANSSSSGSCMVQISGERT